MTPDRRNRAEHAPDRSLAGVRDLALRDVEWTPELVERRNAVAELGDALRELSASAISSEVDADAIRAATVSARGLAATLASRRRRINERSSIDDLRRGQRPYNPVVGIGNPVAPPLHIEYVDDAAVGTCTLDARYEGPLTYAHGGVSALLLDQIMGYAAAAAGHPGVTGRLEVRYRAAVPLGRPLRLEARLIDVLGVRATIRGSIGLDADSASPLVEAEGRFLTLRPEQSARLFGDTVDRS